MVWSKMFRFLTAGESHGQALVATIEGMVAGLPLDEEYINRDLARRQKGFGRGPRMQIEQDRAEIISGVRHGLTLGSPIALLIRNRDWENWQQTMSVTPVAKKVDPVTRLRPGHADLPGVIKYAQSDVRNILERASARDTAARVAVGAVARRFMEEFDIDILSHTLSIGEHRAQDNPNPDREHVEASPVRCADPQAGTAMAQAIEKASKEGDTLGGIFQVIAKGVPIGLGSHVHWERRLSGRLAQALMSIPAVRGVELGAGFVGVGLPGSQFHDVILPGEVGKRGSNRAGGIEGGMSNGQPIVVQVAVKSIATLARPLPSLDLATGQVVQAHYERSDICIVPAAGVVGEAMLAIVLAQAMLEKFGGDHLEETQRNYRQYLESVASRWPKGKD